jgi:hypothetical protein
LLTGVATPTGEREEVPQSTPGGAMVEHEDRHARESTVHWMFQDARGVTRLGPRVEDPETTLAELRRIVAKWTQGIEGPR